MKIAFSRTAFLLLTFGFISTALTAAAHEEKPSKEESKYIPLKKDRIYAPPTRPRMPARMASECMYE
ncbi:MAG: hypothetical protein K2I32_02375, partial [Alistipes sp.]|nr:hypothetical protein [Alistipes sp.]